MLDRTANYVGDDLHVLVRMRAKSLGWCNAVLIDHAQLAEVHAFRIAILGERECVLCLEPAMIGAAAAVRSNNVEHDVSSFLRPLEA